MFLRRFQRRKNGKTHAYWALVESYRTVKGSRQRIVSYLGELKESEQNGWAHFSSKLPGVAARGDSADQPGPRQPWLFEPTARDDARLAVLESRPILVDLKGLRVERLRDFGDVWLAWGLWR